MPMLSSSQIRIPNEKENVVIGQMNNNVYIQPDDNIKFII